MEYTECKINALHRHLYLHNIYRSLLRNIPTNREELECLLALVFII